MSTTQLPETFCFLIIRRISDKLAWVYVKHSGSGLHTFLHRGGENLFPARRPLGRIAVNGGATYELQPAAETARRAA